MTAQPKPTSQESDHNPDRRRVFCDAADHLHQAMKGLENSGLAEAYLGTQQALVSVIGAVTDTERSRRAVYEAITYVGLAAEWAVELYGPGSSEPIPGVRMNCPRNAATALSGRSPETIYADIQALPKYEGSDEEFWCANHRLWSELHAVVSVGEWSDWVTSAVVLAMRHAQTMVDQERADAHRCGCTDFTKAHRWEPDTQEYDEDGYCDYEVCGLPPEHPIHQAVELGG